MKAYNDIETMLIGAGVGSDFIYTNDLKVMNFKQTLANDDAIEGNGLAQRNRGELDLQMGPEPEDRE
eukprot:scaffold7597_cov117-Alexandrium_tamarense.AAC.1